MVNKIITIHILPNTSQSQKNFNFMAPLYGWGSTASRLQSHYEEAVYFLPLISQKFLVLI